MLWPHQPPHTVLGSAGNAAARPLPGGARVHVCLLRCGSSARGDDLTDLALSRYRHDDSLLGACEPDVSKYFIVMQVDGAGWHHSDELVIPSNIRLITQPPYSPEVNPVEHIWDDLREKHFGNRAFPSLDALIEVLCQGRMSL